MGMVSGERTLRALRALSNLSVKVEEARDSYDHCAGRMDLVVSLARALTADEIRGIAHHPGAVFHALDHLRLLLPLQPDARTRMLGGLVPCPVLSALRSLSSLPSTA
jgi:hypothetical protein